MKNLIYYKKGDIVLIGYKFKLSKPSTWQPALFQFLFRNFFKIGVISFNKNGQPTLICRKFFIVKEYILEDFIHSNPEAFLHVVRLYKKYNKLNQNQISKSIDEILNQYNTDKNKLIQFISILKNKFSFKKQEQKFDNVLLMILNIFKKSKNTQVFLLKNMKEFENKFFHVKFLNKK